MSDILYSVADGNDVACPHCGTRSPVSATVAVEPRACDNCRGQFIVRPPASMAPDKGTLSGEGRAARLKLSKSMVINAGPKTGTILTDSAEKIDNIPCAVATATDVGCPRCGKRFKIRPEFYGAVGECKDCACEFIVSPPPPISTMAAPSVEGRAARLKLSKSMVINIGSTSGTILTNDAEEVDGIPCAVATATDVGCPRCGKRFKIRPEFYGAVGECKDCSCEFIVQPPEGTLESAAAPARSAASIRTEQISSAKARLRPQPQKTECMAMSQGAFADEQSGPVRCTPVDGKITCPGCETRYPVSRKFFNTQKVCLKCRCEFFITAPDTA